MNLILILIPALLLSTSFLRVSVIEARQTTPPGLRDDDAPPEEQLRVTLHIGQEGFLLRSGATEGTLAGPDLPLIEGRHPFEQLVDHLRALKDLHPDARQITLSADPDVSYTVVVRAMDATREDGATTLFPDLVVSASGPAGASSRAGAGAAAGGSTAPGVARALVRLPPKRPVSSMAR
ncbi:MAG: biopolymer transporter ExbD [Deltaproteobacteria bacterium]|nr:biopolymer transporter ExbD [Deltaproteobacteria bacterium]